MRTPSLSVVDVSIGAEVLSGKGKFVVIGHADADLLLCRDCTTGQRVMIHVGKLDQPQDASPITFDVTPPDDLSEISEEEWETAAATLETLRPLVEKTFKRGEAKYKVVAEHFGVSVAAIYKWIERYRRSGYLLSSFIAPKRNGGRGKGRIDKDVEAIIKNYIETKFLTLQKRSIKTAIEDIQSLCDGAGLPVPAPNTIKLRIGWIEERIRVEKRHGTATARARFNVHRGSIPNADWPLQMVQIDHTVLPVIIVDSKYRKSIRRAWITVAIDVFSRVILGIYISLDPPSADSVGECLSHALLLKDNWLRENGAPESMRWPFWGTPEVVHADNAKEFRGRFLRTVCKEYGADLQWRPVKKPEWGAHIERLIGTISEWLKQVPGATSSGVDEKWEYDAEGNAILTIEELTEWLIVRIYRYHFLDKHGGINDLTPYQKWMEGIMGTKTGVPRGLPIVRSDVDKVRFNFMPVVFRTIQNDGVLNDNIKYYDDVLRPWVGVRQKDNPGKSVEYPFRRPSHNISSLYFFDPKLKEIFEIRSIHPRMSKWEWEQAQKDAAKVGIPRKDEHKVAEIVQKNRKIEEDAAEKTKSARRQVERRKQHEKKDAKKIATANPRTKASEYSIAGYDPNAIQPLPED